MSPPSQQKPSSGTDQQGNQQPRFEQLAEGSANFEFSGEERGAKAIKNIEKADTDLTAWVHDATMVGKAVDNHFYGERAADVRFHRANLEAKEEDLVMYINGGKIKWITGHTKEGIEKMERGGLLAVWEEYVESGRNSAVKKMTREVMEEDYPRGQEIKLRDLIITYLAVTNGVPAA